MAGTILRRVIRVLDHIYDNPGADLSLDALADVAAMSRFHWHRVWRAATGETLADSVRRIRINRAAAMLLAEDAPVATIASRVGYANGRSFARTFAEIYGLPPAAFRRRGVYSAKKIPLIKGEITMNHDVVIREEPARRVAAMRHIGPYPEVGRAFEKLSAMMAEHGLFRHSRGMIAICYDDPSSVPAADLNSHAGFVMAGDVALPDPIETVTVNGGRHAILRYVGPYAGLSAAYDALYRDWLPASGEAPADAPPFEVYLNSPMTEKPADLITEICLPLRDSEGEG